MLPNELRAAIDKRWESFWPTNNVKPLIIIDLITYLLFLKRIDEQQSAIEATGLSEQHTEQIVYTERQKELRWSVFKDMDAANMHKVFTQEKGVLTFMNQYSKGQHRFSSFMKAPLLVTPTPKLLENAVEVVKMIDAADKDVKEYAYEYLLSKLTTTGPNGELPTPAHITRLMVEMMEPTPDDVIYDPSAGNGRLLATCAAYVKEKYSNHTEEGSANEQFPTDKIIGLEADPVMQRIGAMNMMLHGIDEPKLIQVNALSKANAAFSEQATLVFSNPPFSASPGATELDESFLKMGNQSRPGVLFLALILRGLKKGGRAAVILPESILADSSTAHQQVRQQIIDEHKLEAVISMPAGMFRPYTGVGTAILIFTKTDNGGTDKVWFYNMQTDGFSLDDKRTPLHQSGKYSIMQWPEDYGNIPHLLTQWKALKSPDAPLSAAPLSLPQASGTAAGFFVPAEDIRQNDYSLKVNRYQPQEQKQEGTPKRFVAQEKIMPEPSVLPIPTEQNVLREKNVIPPKNVIPSLKTSVNRSIPSKPILLLLLVVGLGALMYVLIRNTKPNVLSATERNVSDHIAQEQKPTEDQSYIKGQVYTTKLDETPQQGTENEVSTTEEKEARSVSSEVESAENSSRVPQRNVQRAQSTNESRNTAPKENRVTVREPDASAGMVMVQYHVKSRAYFHNQPNEDTRRKAFIQHWDNSYASLNPLDEKNGFIYVVFTNQDGQTSRGWLRKKDLKPVKKVISDNDVK